MKKILVTLVAALALVSAQAPAQAGSNGRNVAKGLAIGLGVGLVAAAVASRSSYASTPSYAYGSTGYGHGYRGGYGYCSELRFACRQGSDRACYKYDTRC